MQLCFGTYAQVLLQCKRTGVRQVELGRELLLSINGNPNAHYNDSSISDLFKGKKNLGQSDIDSACFCSSAEIATRFRNEMEPLLDENKVALAVAAVRELVLNDTTISSLTTVDRVGGLTKSDLERTSCYEPWGFLAGTLIFVASGIRNRGTKQDCASVRDLFTESLDTTAASFVLTDTRNQVPRRSFRVWSDGPSSLNVVEGELFDLVSRGGEVLAKSIAVVPVETSFSTQLLSHLEDLDETGISEKSIHGKWLLRMMSNGLSKDEIDERIHAALVKQGQSEDDTRIGSISVIEVGATAYYLLAVSGMDDNGNTQSSPDKVKQALTSLAIFYDKHGQGYPLYVPLIGNGLSRAHMSIRESYETVRDVFTANRECVHGDVFVVILPDFWDELGLDTDGMGK